MKDEEYKPYVLTSLEKQSDYDYILGILPNNYHEDYYYEIHIKTESLSINSIKEYIGEHIFINLLSSDRLEIYEGEFIEECWCDFGFEYISYSEKRLEKINKTIWKPKFYALQFEYRKLFDIKLKPYEIIRRKIIDDYRNLYDKEVKLLSKIELDQLNRGSFFHSIYQTFEYNPSWDSFNKLIDPDFEYYTLIPRDWELEYIGLAKLYDKLKGIEAESYLVIKEHMIDLYKKVFNRMLPNLKYNYNDVDEEVIRDFFNRVLEKVSKHKP